VSGRIVDEYLIERHPLGGELKAEG
jgi:hypothetical protein